MQVFKINNTNQNNIAVQFKQRVTPKQVLNIIDNSRSFDQVSIETGLARRELNEFCLKNFGKTYKELKSERYAELIKIAKSSIAKKLWVYKLFPHKLQRSHKLSTLPPHKEKDAVRLWEQGASIEDIARAIRAQKEEVFDFLANVAKEKGPIVG